ncbi:hypothetical protein [Sphingosinicella sp.]|uniref:hypothetical protein n=1 Tax=Sphingosinicella sp. TaxID=1917971 RepID=UPI0040383D18
MSVHPASLSRFLIAQGYSLKKAWWRAKPSALTSPRRARLGRLIVSRECANSRTGWCFSMTHAKSADVGIKIAGPQLDEFINS